MQRKKISWNHTNIEDIQAWYHVVLGSFSFVWTPVNYHLTEIIKDPKRFGTTKEHILEVIKTAMKISDEQTVEKEYKKITDGEICHFDEIEQFVEDLGWVKVAIKHDYITLWATKKEAHKQAVRDIMESNADKCIVIQNTKNYHNNTSLRTTSDAEWFLNS